MSVKELAAKMNYSPETIISVEVGSTLISDEGARIWANALGIPVDDIFI